MEDIITRKIQEILIRMLKDFDKFCKDNNLNYVAAYGTVLGAVRHKGIIPWDDDLDVYMTWDDYARFLKLREKATSLGYKIVDRQDAFYYLPMAKFCNTHTTIVERRINMFSLGIYIDVFPIGFVKDLERSKYLHDAYRKWSAFLTRAYFRFPSNFSTFKHFVGHPIQVIKDFRLRNKVDYIQSKLDKLDEEIMSIKDSDYMRYYRAMNTFEKSLYPKEWILETIDVPFEDTTIRIPCDYDGYLTMCYDDYMTLPPIERQVTHHDHYYLNLREYLPIEEVRKRIAKGERTVL